MSKQEQVKCGEFIEEYLQIRENISLVVLILDIRHNPTENDKLMYNYIVKTKRPFIVIANKADKIAITKVQNAVDDIQKELNPLFDILFFPFSSEKKNYSEKTWEELEKHI